MSLNLRLMAFAILSFATAMANAESPPALPSSILGVELGAPLSLKQCSPNKWVPTAYGYEAEEMPCWMHASGPGGPLANSEEVEIAFKRGSVPLGVRPNGNALVVGEQVEAIFLVTTGYDDQAAVLRSLTEKFGEPSEQKAEPMQTRVGASYTALSAHWVGSNVRVEFNGIEGRIDSGSIDIETPAGHDARAKIRAEKHASEPKF